ncbi:MAG TPA: response regulator [Clostridia bacterium]|nr:response regulator [Clostridia bacterium]
MYKVMIVDDDNNVRNGLAVLVPWVEYGFEITGSAIDGKDALEKYEEESFDLIVVDIQMPRVDGLELISIIRKTDPDIHILVLTGHAEFEYARKSIAYRVDGYILKPVDEDELLENIKKISVMLKKEKEEKLLAAGENTLRCEMLVQTILSENTPEAAKEITDDLTGELNERAKNLGMLWPSYQVLLIQPETNEDTEKAIHICIRRSLEKIFTNTARGIVFRWESSHGVLLNNSIKRGESLQRLFDEVNQSMSKKNIVFFASIGEPVSGLMDIGKSYETAERLLKNRFITGSRHILSSFTTPLSYGMPNDGSFDIQSAAGKLYYALDVGNTEAVGQLVCEWESIMTGGGFPEKTIKTNFMQIISTTLNKLSNTNRIGQAKVQEFLADLSGIYGQPDLASLRSFVLTRLDNVIDLLEGGNSEDIVKKIKDIVERNYGEKLTLEVLADAFNYGSGYLGRLFKKYTGESFNTYVDRVRIIKAKELLQQGMKVYQVASRTGYSNVDYFHSKFRKYAGLSPSQFRRDKTGEDL